MAPAGLARRGRSQGATSRAAAAFRAAVAAAGLRRRGGSTRRRSAARLERGARGAACGRCVRDEVRTQQGATSCPEARTVR